METFPNFAMTLISSKTSKNRLQFAKVSGGNQGISK